MGVTVTAPTMVFQFEVEILLEDGKKRTFKFEQEGSSKEHAIRALSEHLQLVINELLGKSDAATKTEEPVTEAKKEEQPQVEVKQGIVINKPKRVNNPGFQPQFREPVD